MTNENNTTTNHPTGAASAGQDNRQYDYTTPPAEVRQEYDIIARMIAPHSRVVDLGCGNGALLSKLAKERSCSAAGIELSPSGVEICRRAGFDVRCGRIDEVLPYSDDTFDYAVCNVTMQMVLYPETLLSEMKRVARRQIVSFPNFAFYKNRMELLFRGRMPRHMLFGYEWYSTGHIHQFSITDFMNLVDAIGGLRVVSHESVEIPSALKQLLVKRFPNLFELIPVFLLEKAG